MESIKLSTKLSLLYVAIYGALACFYPFLTYYFQERELSYIQMGIVFAFVAITGVIVQPIWGFVTDRYSNKRHTIFIAMTVSAWIIYALVFAREFTLVILSIILVMSAQSPIAPLADAYCYQIIERHPQLQYGRIRLMGSFGYAVLALLLGYSIKLRGINSCYFAYSALMLMGIFLVRSIDYQDTSIRQQVKVYDVMNLVRDRRFFLLMVSVVFLNIANGSNGSYIAVLIEKTGGDVTQLGIVWFIIAISELPAFFFGATLLQKFGELNLYILGMLLFALRYFLDSICDYYVPVLVIQLLQSVTYTFYLMSSLAYLNNITASSMRTSAMTLHAAATGIGGVIGSMGGGVLLEHISIFMFYKVLSITCIIGVYVLMLLKNISSPIQQIE